MCLPAWVSLAYSPLTWCNLSGHCLTLRWLHLIKDELNLAWGVFVCKWEIPHKANAFRIQGVNLIVVCFGHLGMKREKYLGKRGERERDRWTCLNSIYAILIGDKNTRKIISTWSVLLLNSANNTFSADSTWVPSEAPKHVHESITKRGKQSHFGVVIPKSKLLLKKFPSNESLDSISRLGRATWLAGILVPWPGIEPLLPAVEAQSPNCWTARDVARA